MIRAPIRGNVSSYSVFNDAGSVPAVYLLSITVTNIWDIDGTILNNNNNVHR